MKVKVYSSDGDIWQGKLKQIPRIGENICINNKTRYGHYVVTLVLWRLDQEEVNIKVSEVE